jgi:hypothetical protein
MTKVGLHEDSKQQQSTGGREAVLPLDVAQVVQAAVAAENMRDSHVFGSVSAGAILHLEGDDGIWRESEEERANRLKVNRYICRIPSALPSISFFQSCLTRPQSVFSKVA